MIGARGKVKIWKATSLYAEGDVGGFNANSGSAFEIHREGRTIVREPVDSSDWSYQVQGGLEFQLSRWFWPQVGWRYLKYDFNKGGFTNKLAFEWPPASGRDKFLSNKRLQTALKPIALKSYRHFLVGVAKT